MRSAARICDRALSGDRHRPDRKSSARKRIAARFLLPLIRSERALTPNELARHLSPITPSLPYSIAPSLPAALESARACPEPILITGSLHFAGEALATLAGTPDAIEDCAQ